MLLLRNLIHEFKGAVCKIRLFSTSGRRDVPLRRTRGVTTSGVESDVARHLSAPCLLAGLAT